MSEPQQPPVPSYGQPDPYAQQPYQQPAQPQAYPVGQPPAQPAPQQYPPSAPAAAQPAQPYAQQPPYAQQQQPAHGAAAQPYGSYASYAPAKPAASGASLGRTAFIIALVGVGLSLLTTLMYPLFYGAIGYDFHIGFGVLNTISGFLLLVVHVAALIIGIIAIRRPGSPILAGIAIGISASAIASIVLSWITNFFYYF